MFRVFLLCLLTLLIAALLVSAYPQDYYLDNQGNLRIENEYIAIFVNTGQENLGRFAMDVTGGNPLHAGDNNKPLIYGHPKPWTSFTTVRINGENYIFGGYTNTRAGREGKVGEVITPPEVINGNTIVTSVRFADIIVTQELSFMESITTGFPDTARIKYTVSNEGEHDHNVGMRIMLDTMLGANDGAPFRVLDQSIIEDKVLVGEAIPEFWQAFDSLQDPMVMAQGNLRGPNLTPPHEVYFSNWGSLADGIWDFDFRRGREFIREGEFELDSAIALFWVPEKLAPGESRTYITSYGLAGITITPGMLTIAASSPARVIFDAIHDSFPIIAYIENTSTFVAKDVTCELTLPEGFDLRGITGVRKLVGDLQPGESTQIAWEVVPKDVTALPEQIEYRVSVSASNTDSSTVRRAVTFATPPILDVELSGPKHLVVSGHRLEPNPFDIKGVIRNIGGSPAYNIKATLALPPGLSLAFNDKGALPLGMLSPREEVEIVWRVQSHLIPGSIPFGLEVKSLNTQTISRLEFVNIPVPPQILYMEVEPASIHQGDFFTVHLLLGNIPNMQSIEMDIKYNDYCGQPIYVSRGGLFTDDDRLLPFHHPDIHSEKGLIAGVSGSFMEPMDVREGTVVSIHFYARRAGEFSLEVPRLEIYDRAGGKIEVQVSGLRFQIE